jgi:hypothetical protein
MHRVTPPTYYAAAAIAGATLAGIGGASLLGATCSGFNGYCTLDSLGWFGGVFLPAGLLLASMFSCLWAIARARGVKTTGP